MTVSRRLTRLALLGLFLLSGVVLAITHPSSRANATTTTTITITTVGETAFPVPAGATALAISLIGSPGQGNTGSPAQVTAIIPTTGLSTVYVEIGSTSGGGHSATGSNGGSASTVQTCPIANPSCLYTADPSTDPRLLVAGGGGGAGQSGTTFAGGAGGNAGLNSLTPAGNGGAGSDVAIGGAGADAGIQLDATIAAVGVASATCAGNDGLVGSPGVGGDGGGGLGSADGGGGGNGWVGGSGGGDGFCAGADGSGGGGGAGSSFAEGSAFGVGIVTAANTSSPQVSITPETAAQVTSANAASFQIGQPGTFTVSATGDPTPALAEFGPLPIGVTFTDNGNGTATLAGTPAVGSAPTYPFTVMATNPAGPPGGQEFTLSVAAAATPTPAATPTASPTSTPAARSTPVSKPSQTPVGTPTPSPDPSPTSTPIPLPASLAVTSSANPAAEGTTVTYTATLTHTTVAQTTTQPATTQTEPPLPRAPAPQQLTFTVNGQALTCAPESTPFDGISATCVTTAGSDGTAVGDNDVVVEYLGDDPSTPVTASLTETITPRPALALKFGFHVGDQIGGASIVVSGTGLLPDSSVTVTAHSVPQTIGSVAVAADGGFNENETLPADLASLQTHHIEVSGTSAANTPVTDSWYFAVGANGIVTNIDPSPALAAPAWTTVSTKAVSNKAVSNRTAPTVRDTVINGVTYHHYDVAAHGSKVVKETQVALFALMAATGGSLALGATGVIAGAASSHSGQSNADNARSKKRRSGSVASAKVKNLKGAHEGIAFGDASPTWRFPWQPTTDALTVSAVVKLARYSPLLARLANDGAYLRAMFGSLGALAPLAGVVSGIAGLVSTGANAVPPPLLVMCLIVGLAVFDAMGGFLAAVVYTVGVVAFGGVHSADSLRALMGIGIVFFGAVLVGSAMRPLRRPLTTAAGSWFDRGADLVVASLGGAWATQKMIGALPALSGLQLPIAAHADQVAAVALAAIALRYILETVATVYYPERLSRVAPVRVPFASRRQRLLSTALGVITYAFVACAYLGNVWQLYVGAVFVVVPALASIYENVVRNRPGIYRLLPRGIFKTVVMLIVGTLVAKAVTSVLTQPQQMLALGFVLLALPGLALSLVGTVGRDGQDPENTWPRRIAGTGVFVVGVLLVRGVIRF